MRRILIPIKDMIAQLPNQNRIKCLEALISKGGETSRKDCLENQIYNQ